MPEGVEASVFSSLWMVLQNALHSTPKRSIIPPAEPNYDPQNHSLKTQDFVLEDRKRVEQLIGQGRIIVG